MLKSSCQKRGHKGGQLAPGLIDLSSAPALKGFGNDNVADLKPSVRAWTLCSVA